MSNIKNIYIAVQIKENEKYYAYVVKTTDNNNLLSVLEIKGIISANIWSKTYALKQLNFGTNNLRIMELICLIVHHFKQQIKDGTY
jgi:hypothetical protein